MVTEKSRLHKLPNGINGGAHGAVAADHRRGFGGITGTQGKVPFFLIGRRKTLSPEVTYSVCRPGPPNTTLDGSHRQKPATGYVFPFSRAPAQNSAGLG